MMAAAFSFSSSARCSPVVEWELSGEEVKGPLSEIGQVSGG